MRVLIFGATGMVGQGVLRECLKATDIEEILTVGRHATAIESSHPEVRQLTLSDMWNYDGHEQELRNFDACYFCLGVSSSGQSEVDYKRLTYDFTLAAATTLVRLNPHMTFIYVSGSGTDSSGEGRVMWARVKGQTENALLKLGFKATYLFRPGVIAAVNGEVSKTLVYRRIYSVLNPFIPLLRWIAPSLVTTTEEIGQAMLEVTRNGYAKPILESFEISRLKTTSRPEVK